ncbi:MAG: Rho termination factor N-terminal domain-containing protein [Thermodesulfobacteriota bacterium]|nr:Rho termination factor N-terminal domain-containing protein [Thermodesulfobacteriota bacterium]
MAILGKGTAILKAPVPVALWGIGIYIGLRVAKPVLEQVAKGCASVGEKLKRCSCTAKKQEVAETEIPIESADSSVTPAVAGGPEVAAAGIARAVSIEEAETPQPVPAETTEEIPLQNWSRARLYAKAKELGIAGRSTMNKQELLAALQDKMTPTPVSA